MADRSLHDRLLDARDSILANPSFQRFAGTFPLTRPVARKRAGDLFDLCAGFVYSQILLACVQSRLFERLRNGPLSAADVASAIALPLERATLLLDAAVALRLVQARSEGRYGLGPLGAALLGNPGVAAMIEHHAMLYGDLSNPPDHAARRRDIRCAVAILALCDGRTAERPHARAGRALHGADVLIAADDRAGGHPRVSISAASLFARCRRRGRCIRNCRRSARPGP